MRRFRSIGWLLLLWAFVCVLTFAALAVGFVINGDVIAYIARADDTANIHYLDLSRSLSLQVTDYDSRRVGAPRWSPDGTRLAFINDTDNYDIYLMDMNGANARNLTQSDNMNEFAPAWSPDGTRLVFPGSLPYDAAETLGSELFVLNIASGSREQITHNITPDLGSIDWTPHGDALVYVSQQRDYLQIAIADADGENMRHMHPIDADQHSPDWSPDAQQVVYTSSDALFIYDLQTEESQRLTYPGDFAIATNAKWSPNGCCIVFSAIVVGSPDLYVIDVTTRELTQLTDTPTVAEHSPDWRP